MSKTGTSHTGCRNRSEMDAHLRLRPCIDMKALSYKAACQGNSRKQASVLRNQIGGQKRPMTGPPRTRVLHPAEEISDDVLAAIEMTF